MNITQCDDIFRQLAAHALGDALGLRDVSDDGAENLSLISECLITRAALTASILKRHAGVADARS